MKELQLTPLDEQRIDAIRKEAAGRIYEDAEFSSFILKNNIGRDMVLQNASKFLRAIEERDKCGSCPGIARCPNAVRGIRLSLDYDEESEKISLVFRPCDAYRRKEKIDAKFLIREFPDDFLRYELKDAMTEDYRVQRKQIVSDLMGILKSDGKKGLYLYGGRMTGKTFIMSVFATKYVDMLGTAAFIDASSQFKYLNDLNFTDKEGFNSRLNLLKMADLLVIDDFGNEYKNEFLRDTIVYPLLNERLRERRLTCFTSCYSLRELGQMYALREKDSPKARQLVSLLEALANVRELKGMAYRE